MGPRAALEDLGHMCLPAPDRSQANVALAALDEVGVVAQHRERLDEKAEIDVLGLIGDMAVLIGECKWATREIGPRDLTGLRAKAVCLELSDEVRFAYWTRGKMRPNATAPDV
jgi:hypothetical protein